MESRIKRLLKEYENHVSLPWPDSLPFYQRVWFVVYRKTDERKLRKRLDEFALTTQQAGHKWVLVDLASAFSEFMSSLDYRDGYFENPTALATQKENFLRFVADKVLSKLSAADQDTVVALSGLGGLFGLVKTSRLIDKVEKDIRGRLVVFFPGSYINNRYKFFDVGDDWNYRAFPIVDTQRG